MLLKSTRILINPFNFHLLFTNYTCTMLFTSIGSLENLSKYHSLYAYTLLLKSASNELQLLLFIMCINPAINNCK